MKLSLFGRFMQWMRRRTMKQNLSNSTFAKLDSAVNTTYGDYLAMQTRQMQNLASPNDVEKARVAYTKAKAALNAYNAK